MTEMDWVLLSRYAAGDCTAAERAEVERWLAAAPEHRARLEAIHQAAALAGHVLSPRERTELRADLRAKIAAAKPSRRSYPLSRSLWPLAVKIAAALLLIVGGAAAGYVLLRQRESQVATISPVHTISTARGQRMSLRLADGTHVLLAPASTLQFPATYGTRDRSVRLTGEAVFTVVHDSIRPFTVRTARLVAHDLGTRFVVRAYGEDSVADVVVAEGVVAVTPDSSGAARTGQRLVLSRGERAQATSGGALALARGVPLDPYFAWTEGRLVFRRTPLREAVRQLGRWHDVEIRLASDAMDDLGVTASFPADAAVSEILDAVARALRLEVVETAPRHYTLRAK